MFLPLVFSVYCSEMDYFTGNSRTRRRKIKVRVQQHLLSLAMEDMEQADQAVDQAVQEFGEALNGNSDEAVNLDFDVSTEDVDLYKASDPDDHDDIFSVIILQRNPIMILKGNWLNGQLTETCLILHFQSY